MSVDEIMAALAVEIGTKSAESPEVKALGAQLQEHAPALRQMLLNAGAKAVRKDYDDKLAAVVAERDAANEKLTALQGEFDEHKKKAPDLAAVETKWGDKLKDERATHKKELTEREARVVGILKQSHRNKLIAELLASGVDADYAEVTASKYDNRIDAKPDGTSRILQLDADLPIDAPDAEKAIKLLAKDVLKTVPPKFVSSNADGGGGAQNGGGGNGTLTEKQILERKQTNPMYRGVL